MEQLVGSITISTELILDGTQMEILVLMETIIPVAMAIIQIVAHKITTALVLSEMVVMALAPLLVVLVMVVTLGVTQVMDKITLTITINRLKVQ